jgi:Na+/H+ antiporter NhaD/arsenite permease-like protein
MTALVIVFCLGYCAIAFEHIIKINKAATALLTGICCWIIYISQSADKHVINEQLMHQLADVSGILFFLLGAMTIVELIDAHDGFEIITNQITTNQKRKLLILTAFFTFFLSALLDNLTTTIVMVSLLGKLIHDKTNRLFFTGLVVIAANAGGCWSPIGDVTTTMLWMGGQITATTIIKELFLPSLVCLLLPLSIVTWRLKGNFILPAQKTTQPNGQLLPRRHQVIVLMSGICVLISVPIFKTVTHLPPYMGILLGLGILWVITELLHGHRDEEDKEAYSVVYALRKIDSPSILFFLGILLSVAALNASGLLKTLSERLMSMTNDLRLITYSTGVLSSIVDNVPLVAATQGMYSMNVYPVNHFLWTALTYCAGTGGSLLIIGSAAGVAAMGIEKISFGWYLKHMTWLAFLGYTGGFICYLLLTLL